MNAPYVSSIGEYLTNSDGNPFSMDAGGYFLNVGTWFLIFVNFVPISLLVTLETVKFFQAFFIQWDLRMY